MGNAELAAIFKDFPETVRLHAYPDFLARLQRSIASRPISTSHAPFSLAQSRSIGPSAWSLLVATTHLSSLPEAAVPPLAEIVLETAKCVCRCEQHLKMGRFDLDKMLANVCVRLLDAVRVDDGPLPLAKVDSLLELLEFARTRIQTHCTSMTDAASGKESVETNGVETDGVEIDGAETKTAETARTTATTLTTDIRRLSLLGPVALFRNLTLSPSAIAKDATLLQVALIAQESLLRLVLLIDREASEETRRLVQMLEALFATFISVDPPAAKKNLVYFFAAVGRIQHWARSEWTLWAALGRLLATHPSLASEWPVLQAGFKRRLSRSLREPEHDVVLDLRLVALALQAGQLSDAIVQCATRSPALTDGAEGIRLVAALLHALAHIKEDASFVAVNELLVKHRSVCGVPSESPDLKPLLASMEHLRTAGGPLLTKPPVLRCMSSLNAILQSIKLPPRLMASWTTSTLKTLVNGQCDSNDAQQYMRDTTAMLLDLDLGECQAKTLQFIAQMLPTVKDNCAALNRLVEKRPDLLAVVLDHAVRTLSTDTFDILTQHAFHAANDTIATKWVKIWCTQKSPVLEQHPFVFADADEAYVVIKAVLRCVIDRDKAQRMLEHLYARMQASDISPQHMALCRQTASLKWGDRTVSVPPLANCAPFDAMSAHLSAHFAGHSATETPLQPFAAMSAHLSAHFAGHSATETPLQPFAAINPFTVSILAAFELLELFLNVVVVSQPCDSAIAIIKALNTALKHEHAHDVRLKSLLLRLAFFLRPNEQILNVGPFASTMEMRCELDGLRAHDTWLTSLEEFASSCSPSNTQQQSYWHYRKGETDEALRVAYSHLKMAMRSKTGVPVDRAFSTLSAIVHLHRLSITTRNLSEARYFVKQGLLLSQALRSEPVERIFHGLQTDLDILTGKNGFDQMQCEELLLTGRFRQFFREREHLTALQRVRKEVHAAWPERLRASVATNGIKIARFESEAMQQRMQSVLVEARVLLERAVADRLTYCVGEWAKLLLSLVFTRSMLSDGASLDAQITLYFELARRPEDTSILSSELAHQPEDTYIPVSLALPGNSLGLVYDQMGQILWVLVSNCESKLIVFRVPRDRRSHQDLLHQLHSICAQNTETLRNTKDIAADDQRRAEWWSLRRRLDAELSVVCDRFSNEFFGSLQEAIVPCERETVKSANLFYELNSMLSRAYPDLTLAPSLATQLGRLGGCPKRHKLEAVATWIDTSLELCVGNERARECGTRGRDQTIAMLRKCFENVCDLGSIFDDDASPHGQDVPYNLLLDKHLNAVPFESLPLLASFTFRRIPGSIRGAPLADGECAVSAKDSKNRVFYIVNPSGDLVKTQERFETLFSRQSNWKGIVGRAPSADEFMEGIRGEFELFLYFGHSGGEGYVALQELKLHACDHASSALLIGCSSGRIKENGVFPPEAAIYHYLDSKSPLVLANLWDVTDRDIDTYIRGVLEDSHVLNTKNEFDCKGHTAAAAATTRLNLTTLTHTAQKGRTRCFLKALNGASPIVYSTLQQSRTPSTTPPASFC